MVVKDRLNSNNKRFLYLLIALFILKGVFYAAYVVPLTMGASPDDMGHFSYIQYVASQRRLPVHNHTPMESSTYRAYIRYSEYREVIDFIIEDEAFDSTRINWIAQHPPLYYILMAIVYSITSLFTRQFSTIILILRLANLAFGVASIVYLSKILDILKAKDIVKKCVLIFFVFSVSLQFFFLTITNDSMLYFTCIFALYYLLKYRQSNRLRDFIVFVIGAALIFGTKYNGFMVMLSYVAFFLYHSVRRNGFKETVKLSSIAIPIGLAIILPDLLHSHFTAGRLITNDGGLITGIGAQPAYSHNFMDFIFRTDYISQISRNIIMLIGWRPMIIADEFILNILAAIFLFIAVVCAFRAKNRVISAISALSGAIIFGLFQAEILPFGFSFGLSMVLACLFMIFCFTVIKTKELGSGERDIHWFFIATIVITVVVYMSVHFGHFQRNGFLRALHGRYYYIVFLPFSYLLFYQLGELKTKFVKYVPVALALTLGLIELHAISLTLYHWRW